MWYHANGVQQGLRYECVCNCDHRITPKKGSIVRIGAGWIEGWALPMFDPVVRGGLVPVAIVLI
jgi:hypothetical protein